MNLSIVQTRNYKVIFFPQEGCIKNSEADAKYIADKLSIRFSYIRILKKQDSSLIVYLHSNQNSGPPVRMSYMVKRFDIPFYKRAVLPYYQYTGDDEGTTLLLEKGTNAQTQSRTNQLNEFLEDLWIHNQPRSFLEFAHVEVLNRYKHFYRNLIDIRDGRKTAREKLKNDSVVAFLK